MDSTRRDALAHQNASRIALLGEEDQRVVDALLVHFEMERDGSLPPDAEIEGLRRGRYNEDEGDLGQLKYRRGWNDNSRYTEAIRRVNVGLTELRRQLAWLTDEAREEAFGGEG